MIEHEMEGGHRSPSDQKSSLVSIKTSDFCLEGRKGEWTAVESIIIDDSEFFLMEHLTSEKPDGRVSILKKLHSKQTNLEL